MADLRDALQSGPVARAIREAAENSTQVYQIKLRIGEKIIEKWKEAGSGAKLPGMTQAVHNTDFSQALGVVRLAKGEISIPFQGGANIKRMVDLVEKGHEPIDMKPRLLASAKAKTSAAGTTYLIVPFTHSINAEAASQSIPSKFSKLLEANPRRGHGRTVNQPAFQPRTPAEAAPYGRGRAHMTYGRATKAAPKTKPRYAATHSREPYRQKFGHLARLTGTPSRGLTTLRTVTSNSPDNSWILPARPPNPVTDAVIRAALTELGLATR